ncbi:MAG: hypothetical protein KGL39_01440 [Patescibacteria group bacterium]|nr:hypothetical protein [Patescibacteria group bacterium]
MDIGNAAVAVAILAIIIFVVVFFGGFIGAIGKIFNRAGDIIDKGGKVIEDTSKKVVDVWNPDNWKQTGARFCCDVFTKEQLAKMVQHNCLPCNPNCDRTQSPGCMLENLDIDTMMKQSCTKTECITGDKRVNPTIRACQGELASVEKPATC